MSTNVYPFWSELPIGRGVIVKVEDREVAIKIKVPSLIVHNETEDGNGEDEFREVEHEVSIIHDKGCYVGELITLKTEMVISEGCLTENHEIIQLDFEDYMVDTSECFFDMEYAEKGYQYLWGYKVGDIVKVDGIVQTATIVNKTFLQGDRDTMGYNTYHVELKFSNGVLGTYAGDALYAKLVEAVAVVAE